ncbi:MAG TPA: hypothetical protein PLI09_01365 [Candidatus Hydrogenedentes bacterium]|nr:hypothetical protein [Candidatus Hydrogenedentota bacterium]
MNMELEPFVFRHEGVLVGMRAWTEAAEAEAGEEALREAVNRFALRPLRREEFAVFTLDLCHNQVDKHFSRFPEEELEKINEMVLGRPLMERHDLRGSLPRGTFFRSQLHREGNRVSVRPEVYVLRTADNADFILNIEGGVYRETSIGFSFRLPECSICGKDIRSCDHVPGHAYDDQTCHFIMRDVLEVIEGSIVSSGSQGTRFVARDRALPPEQALDVARKAVQTPVNVNSPAESENVVPEWVEEARAAMKTHLVKPKDAAQLIQDGVEARRRAIERFCGLGRVMDGANFDESVWRVTLDHLSLREIHHHLEAYEVRFDEKYPPQPVSQPEPLPEEDPQTWSERGMALLKETSQPAPH